jgi:hypothetical protein
VSLIDSQRFAHPTGNLIIDSLKALSSSSVQPSSRSMLGLGYSYCLVAKYLILSGSDIICCVIYSTNSPFVSHYSKKSFIGLNFSIV